MTPIFEHSIHVAVWSFIEENPYAKKSDWPGWSNQLALDQKLLIDSYHCMACYYNAQIAEIYEQTGGETPYCFCCPLVWPGGHCARGTKDGVFNRFKNCESPQFKSAYAKIIKTLPVRTDIIRR